MPSSRGLAALLLSVACAARAEDAATCARALATPLPLGAIDERVRCNRDVIAAERAVDAARADLRTAGQRQNPNLTLGVGSINPAAGIGAGTLRDKAVDSSARIDQLVERGNKVGLRVAQAQAALDAARADHADQLRQQRAAARSAFFDLAAAQAKVAAQREAGSLAQQSAEAAQRRVDAGEISRNEANRFRLDAARAANDLRQAEADAIRARAELARLLGAESSALQLEVRPEWPTLLPERRGGDRADVAAARKRVAAAESARDLARALGTRDVTVGVQADHSPVNATNTNGNGNFFGVSVSVPLFVSHAHEGEKARALADVETARAVLRRAEAAATSEAAIALEDWRAAIERRRRLESESAPLAREVAEGAEFAYRKGASGILDLLDARRTLKSAQVEEVQALADEAKAWARYLAAIEPYEEKPDAP